MRFINIIAICINLILLVSSYQAFGEIMEVQDFILLEDTLKTEDSDTLVIFDVDHVLIMPKEDYAINSCPYRKQLWEKLQGCITKERAEFLESIMTANAKWRLIEPEVIKILSNLKKHSIPTIALTASRTGKLGVIDNREELRIRELKEVGISFIGYPKFSGTIIMYELNGKSGTPMLKSGIISTAELDKALVLEYILNSKNYHPKKIIFIDDIRENLESLEKLCNRLGIKYHGFYYTKVSTMNFPDVNEEAEDLRFKILEEEGIWLTNEELIQRFPATTKR